MQNTGLNILLGYNESVTTSYNVLCTIQMSNYSSERHAPLPHYWKCKIQAKGATDASAGGIPSFSQQFNDASNWSKTHTAQWQSLSSQTHSWGAQSCPTKCPFALCCYPNVSGAIRNSSLNSSTAPIFVIHLFQKTILGLKSIVSFTFSTCM